MEAATTRNNNGLIWLGVLSLAGVVVYKKYVVPNVIVPLKVKKYTRQLKLYIPIVKLTKDAVQFGVRIENPNATPMTVRALVGDTSIIYNGNKAIKLGRVSKYGDTPLKPLGETEYNFEVKLNPIRLFEYFSLLLSGKIKSQTFLFQGTINIDSNTYPVKEFYKIA